MHFPVILGAMEQGMGYGFSDSFAQHYCCIHPGVNLAVNARNGGDMLWPFGKFLVCLALQTVARDNQALVLQNFIICLLAFCASRGLTDFYPTCCTRN